jgi:hypothetical protein
VTRAFILPLMPVPLTWHSLFHTVEGVAAVATIGLAFGTVVLALATFLTAKRTRTLAVETGQLAVETTRVVELTEQELKAVMAQAQAAREEVEVSREALQASVRPCLVDMPSDAVPVLFETNFREKQTIVRVPIRNVGAGLAMIQAVRMCWHETGLPANVAVYTGTTDVRVLPPRENLMPRFFFDEPQATRVEHIRDLRRFWVEIDYHDVPGKQAETTRLYITRRDDDGPWKVTGVELLREGDSEPYISSSES